MSHVANFDTINLNSTTDTENNVEMSTEQEENNQTGGGHTTDETSDCITEEEAINGNLKVYNLPALAKTKYDRSQMYTEPAPYITGLNKSFRLSVTLNFYSSEKFRKQKI